MRFSFNFQLPGNGNPFIFPTIAFGAVFWLIAVGVATALGLAMYALNGVGVSAMAKKLGVAHPNGAYVPFYRYKIFGDVAEAATLRNPGAKRRKYGKILFGLLIGYFAAFLLFFVVFFVIFAIAIASSDVAPLSSGDAFSGLALLLTILVCIAVYIGLMVVAVLLTVFNYMAYYQIYRCFSPEYAVLWLLLTIFVPASAPILMLILGRNTPAPLPYGERA